MRGNNNALAGFDGRCHGFIPERQDAFNSVFQAFGQWHLAGLKLGVTAITALAAFVAGLQRRRRRVIASAPNQYLCVTVFFCGLGFVQPLQSAIVPFVEAPAVHHRKPSAVHLVQGVPQRVRGALQHAGVSQIKVIAFAFKQLAGVFGLGNTGFGQLYVGPAGEAVFKVPDRFSMADQYEFVHV